MILINLLPYDRRPIEHSPIPYILSGMVLVGVVIFVANSWLSMEAEIASREGDLEGIKSSFNQLLAESAERSPTGKDIVTEYNDLVREKAKLASKVEVIRGIVTDRIIWSKQLFNLSALTPENFWYRDIAVESKQVTESREVTNEKGEKVIESYQVTRRFLKLQGYAVEDDERNKSVNPLVDALSVEAEDSGALKDEDSFSSMFRLSRVSFLDTEFDNFPVRSFTIEFEVGAPGGTQ